MRQLLAFLAAFTAVMCVAPTPSRAQSTIRIGEINSYSGIPAFTLPYRNGAQLAVEEANAAGGVLGRKIDVLFVTAEFAH